MKANLRTQKSRDLLQRALKKIPGAVNSPVRAWSAVKGSTLFIARAHGAHVFDVDGNRFLDYVGAYGPAILGHADVRVAAAVAQQSNNGFGYGAPTELEVELAETISSAIAAADKVRLVNSGTEAGMTAIRIARAATHRDKIIKFDGCYHGHSDGLLVRAGSGLLTHAVQHNTASSAGVPSAVVHDTLFADYNNLDSVVKLFKDYPDNIAAVIIEPIPGNMNMILPK